MLHGLRLANVHNVHTPRYMKVGNRLLRTDWSLMVFLKRMSANITYKDLRFVVEEAKPPFAKPFCTCSSTFTQNSAPGWLPCVCVCTRRPLRVKSAGTRMRHRVMKSARNKTHTARKQSHEFDAVGRLYPRLCDNVGGKGVPL